MADYRISVRARADLFNIYEFTEARFGAYQAEAYHAGLERSFGLLADFPRIGLPAYEFAPALRRFRFQSHSIFYVEEFDHVLIRTLIHTSQKLRPQLFR